MKRCITVLLLCLGLCGALRAAPVWPTKRILVIVPYAAGSTPDLIARLIFDQVGQSTGQPVIVENKPGAGGMIGADFVAKSTPDGSTLLLAPSGPLETDALLYKKMTYDPVKDLAPVALVAETPSVVVTSNAVSAPDARALLRDMADASRKLAYASPGYGTLSHLSTAYLVARSGGNVPHVAYPGSPQVVTGLIANDVQIATLPPLAVAPFIRAGKIRAVALVGTHRSDALPDVATLREQGVDFDPVGWFGVAAPGGTPAPVLEAVHDAISAALKNSALVQAYRAQGLEVADLGPDAFAAYIRKDLVQWRPVIEQNHISLD
ncbi:MAG TPA: tripartite tricarboxylate transporter substrate binding protein [Bordetella sp.]